MQKNVRGIYKIANKVNDLIYIGSSIKCVKTRWSYHVKDLRANKHHSSRLQNHYNKYGEQSLNFELIEQINDTNSVIEREQFYIDTLKPQFNMCPTAGNCSGRKFTEETKRKMSEIAKKRGLNEALKLQQKSPYPPETDTEKYCGKCKIYHNKNEFAQNSGNTCKAYFNANRKSRSILGARKNSITKVSTPIICMKNNEIVEFCSMRECVRQLISVYPKINRFNIKRSIESNKEYYGYMWSYKNA